MSKNLFSKIPKVDEILNNEKIKNLLDEVPRQLLMESIREELDELREKIKTGKLDEISMEQSLEKINDKIEYRVTDKDRLSLRRTINGTGVVIHTNLGRSLMGEEVMDNLKNISSNYSNLEYNLERGERGIRYSHVEDIIQRITGAEAALVVNNNAAAVLLALSAMASGKEVIVSRGELIEIGGSFRIPDVMEAGGSKLVEVGTTNKTHLRDYESAITEETGALLKVHTSNYKILGFTSGVGIDELVEAKEKYNIPIIEDLGSGILIDLSKYGLTYEPTVQESLEKGADIVTFSGDKLLGGPQAGIIVGKKEYIDEMKSHPLTRALRPDKFTLAALEITLRYYLDEKVAIEKIPTLKMILAKKEELEFKSNKLYEELKSLGDGYFKTIDIEDGYSEVGGGSLPLEKLPTKSISITFNEFKIGEVERELRMLEIPIIVRLFNDKMHIDVRTIKEEEIPIIVQGMKEVIGKL